MTDRTDDRGQRPGHEQGRGPLIRKRREKRRAALAAAERSLPVTFAVVGVQKAATSTLYRMLVKHPEVAGGPEKEMRFFLDEQRDWSAPDYTDYARPANRRRLRLAGDATPAYFFWPHALERMAAYDPHQRLIVSLRDPIERAFSQWSMERYWDPQFPDLADAVERWGHDELPTDVPAGVTPARLRKESLFVRGLYGEQLARGLEHFPREQWLVLDFRDVFTHAERTLDATTDFLGIERFTDHPPVLHQNQTPTDHTGRAPSVAQVAGLVERFAPDLARLEELSGLDTSAWSTSRVAAGELSADQLTAKLLGKLGLA